MNGSLYEFLSDDHNRLDGLLRRSLDASGQIDRAAYGEFRSGLLRHIAMEERVLLPDIMRRQGGRPLPVAERVRLDHGALAALLVPPPSPSIITTIRSILQVHNALEEQEGGLYITCEQVAGPEAEELLAKLKATPEVPVMPYNERPEVLEATRRAVERAGYRLKQVP